MGYTHYFTAKKVVSESKKKAIISDMKKIEEYFKNNDLPLFGPRGLKVGVLYKENEFMFNGDYSKHEAHETMYFEFDNPEFNFCKTNHKPYDVAVTTTLLMLKYHLLKNIEVSSDGGFDGFEEGIEAFNKIFPKRNVVFKDTNNRDDGDIGIDKVAMKLKQFVHNLD